MIVPPYVKRLFFKLHSVTLPVKARLQARGILVAWQMNCLLCKCPESVDHAYIHCRDAVLYWDVLKSPLKTELYVTPHSIRFFLVPKNESAHMML